MTKAKRPAATMVNMKKSRRKFFSPGSDTNKSIIKDATIRHINAPTDRVRTRFESRSTRAAIKYERYFLSAFISPISTGITIISSPAKAFG